MKEEVNENLFRVVWQESSSGRGNLDQSRNDAGLRYDFGLFGTARLSRDSVIDSGVNAVRGHKIWNLINIGDPRRNYHSIEVSVNPGIIHVKTQIDSWFGLGTQYDKAVFEAEIIMLRHFLQTRELSLAPLQEAQALRRKSDIKTFLIIIGVGICIGIVAAMILTNQ